MKTKITLTLLLLTGLMFGAEKAKSIYKTHRLTDTVVAISCENGADPTVEKNIGGNILIVSCGR